MREPHRLAALVLEDLQRYPESAIGDIHRRIGGEIHPKQVKRALDAGLLINVTHDTVVRLLPPLVINDAESAELVSRLAAVIKEFLS